MLFIIGDIEFTPFRDTVYEVCGTEDNRSASYDLHRPNAERHSGGKYRHGCTAMYIHTLF